jgi:glycosyltransferase involved in cell wall biosynthesis
MALKKIARKATIGAKVLRDEGLLSFSIKSLQHAQKRTGNKSRRTQTSKQPLYMRVKYRDALTADLTKKPPTWPGSEDKVLGFNWVMPPPGKGSGGHLNIFRFIKFLEDAGHRNHIYLYADGGKGSVAPVRAAMGDSYPKLKAPMEWLEDGQEMQAAHGTFATSWETAYAVFNSSLTTRRFYFVQDFEPYFYPVGSMYALAENSYKFGFYGITAGGWLSKKLSNDYGMSTDYFNFGADKQLYSFKNDQSRNEVFCYVRPYTERRGFELAVMALDLFHQKHPDYTINLAGWDVSEYDLPFPYRNLKTLEVEALNDLYNRCAAGLVLSFTNMSLLPLELLSSGTIPVVNDGENNRLVSDNPFIAYAADNPAALATRLSDIISRPDSRAYAKEAAASVAKDSWQEAGSKFVSIVERETRRHE